MIDPKASERNYGGKESWTISFCTLCTLRTSALLLCYQGMWFTNQSNWWLYSWMNIPLKKLTIIHRLMRIFVKLVPFLHFYTVYKVNNLVTDGHETQHAAENSSTSTHHASQLEQREGFPSAAPARSSSWHNNSPAPCWDASPVFSLYVLGGRAARWGGGTQSWDDAVRQPAGFH